MFVVIVTVILIILAACTVFLWAENNLLQVSRHTLPLLTEGKVRIVHLSDLHDKTFGKENKKLLSKVKKLNPDLICYTGDLNRRHTLGHYHNGTAFLRALCGIAPTLYAFGNHEVMGEEQSAILAELEGSGVILLQNSSEDFRINGATLSVFGLDAALRKPAFVALCMEQFAAQSSGCRIVLCHYPQFFTDNEHVNLSDYPVDLVLAGHAHGGQVRLFGRGLFAPEQGIFPKYTAGLHRKNGSGMIISRGLGSSTFPFRVFNRPEIVVIDLTEQD